MDEGMEKRGKIQRATTHDDRSKLDPIPLDLISEILSRLPVKSIVRCQCVSKLWSSCTKHQSFINSFATRSCERTRRILLIFSTESKRIVFSVPQEDGSSSPLDSYEMTNPQDWSDPLSESVQGLVLLHDGLVLWNPSLRRFINLPKPETSNEGMSFLGYDPLEGKHKVVRVDVGESQHARVLTLGAQESWRTITKASPWESHFVRGGRCFNGILYYSSRFGTPGFEQRSLMSFDVRSEKFNSIKFPEDYKYSFQSNLMIPYEGKLAVVCPDIYYSMLEMWMLEDADGHKWTNKRFLVLSRIGGVRMNHLYFKGVTDAGELIFAPSCLFEPFYILYFDPRRNSKREAMLEGIVGVGFRRRRYGLGKLDIREFDTVTNHMESLVSSF